MSLLRTEFVLKSEPVGFMGPELLKLRRFYFSNTLRVLNGSVLESSVGSRLSFNSSCVAMPGSFVPSRLAKLPASILLIY